MIIGVLASLGCPRPGEKPVTKPSRSFAKRSTPTNDQATDKTTERTTESSDNNWRSPSEPDDVRYQESRFHRDHDKFPAANMPPLVAAEFAGFLTDQDEVLGVVLDGRARAYDIRMLSYHHVVNDRIGDRPIVVTY